MYKYNENDINRSDLDLVSVRPRLTITEDSSQRCSEED